jgi:hypothetical protein
VVWSGALGRQGLSLTGAYETRPDGLHSRFLNAL